MAWPDLINIVGRRAKTDHKTNYTSGIATVIIIMTVFSISTTKPLQFAACICWYCRWWPRWILLGNNSQHLVGTMSMLKILRSLPSFRPGIAYVIDKSLYLAPSGRSPAANTMRSCRGPIFSSQVANESDGINASPPLPESRTSQNVVTAIDTGFEPLPDGAEDPTANELASLVDEYYAARTPIESLGSMGENDGGVVFQGEGDPMTAAEVVVDTVRLVAERRNGIAFRLNTLGLCSADDTELLLSSGVLGCGDADQRRETRIATISVFLPAANPNKYAELLQPKLLGGLGLGDVCSFVARLAEAGANVECTAVARPDVNVGEVKALAMSLGATSFRTRSWLGSSAQ